MRRKRNLQRDLRNGNYFVWIRRSGFRRYFALGPNKKVAERQLDQIERDVTSGRIQFAEQQTSRVVRADGSNDMRIEELAVKHLEWVKANRSIGTFRNRQHFVLQFLEFAGEAMVSDITRLRLEEFYAWAKQNHSRSANGGNEALANVKSMLLWGEEMELYGLPFRKFPRMTRTPPETKRISEEDLKLLLSAAPDDFRDVLLFGMLTGLRPSELMGLRRCHFQLDSKGDSYVRIEKHKTSRSSRTPKPRTVPLSTDAREILRRQVEDHPKTDFVFLNGNGTPYERHAFKRRLERLCSKAKLSRTYSPYSLRHTFASMESDAGVETTSLARLMGHTTSRTLERYVSNTFAHHKNAVEMLGERVRQIVGSTTDGGEIEAKCATKSATERTGENRLENDAIVTRSNPAS
jgi:integrase